MRNADLRFTIHRSPLLVDADGVLGFNVYGTTDDDGYFELDLYRTGEYLVEIESLEHQRCVTVPDVSSANLVELMFPVVASVAYDPTAVTVAEGESVSVEVTVTDSAGLTHELTDALISFTSADETIATIGIQSNQLVVSGRVAGSTTIDAAPADASIVVIPEITLDSLSVTVS